MKKQIALAVGQQVCIVFNQSSNGLKQATVTKVGTKWTTLETNSSYKRLHRAPNGSRILEGANRGYSSEGTIYLSEQEYADQQATEAAWKAFRELISRHYGCPDLTVQQITTMHEIVESASK